MRYIVNNGHFVQYDDKNIWVNGERSLRRIKDPALLDFVIEVCGETDVIDTSEIDDEFQRNAADRALAALAQAGVLVPIQGVNRWPDIVLNLSNYSEGTRPLDSIQSSLDTGRVAVLAPTEKSFAEMLVTALGDGSEGTRLEVSLFEDLGALQVRDHFELTIVVGSADGDNLFNQVNRIALEDGWRVWLPVIPPLGATYQIGPWLYPNSSACYKCYQLRKASVSWSDNQVAPSLSNDSISVPRSLYDDDILTTNVLSSLIAKSALMHVGLNGYIGQAPHGFVSHIQNTMEGFESDNHFVLRVPRCPECSPAENTGYPQIWFHGSEQGK